tara:strand:- start:923 stop:1135 length:213 start_codon:yes stop_codon:yes gene_type:complete
MINEFTVKIKCPATNVDIHFIIEKIKGYWHLLDERKPSGSTIVYPTPELALQDILHIVPGISFGEYKDDE